MSPVVAIHWYIDSESKPTDSISDRHCHSWWGLITQKGPTQNTRAFRFPAPILAGITYHLKWYQQLLNWFHELQSHNLLSKTSLLFVSAFFLSEGVRLVIKLKVGNSHLLSLSCLVLCCVDVHTSYFSLSCRRYSPVDDNLQIKLT